MVMVMALLVYAEYQQGEFIVPLYVLVTMLRSSHLAIFFGLPGWYLARAMQASSTELHLQTLLEIALTIAGKQSLLPHFLETKVEPCAHHAAGRRGRT